MVLLPKEEYDLRKDLDSLDERLSYQGLWLLLIFLGLALLSLYVFRHPLSSLFRNF
jgi:hypothetical protein